MKSKDILYELLISYKYTNLPIMFFAIKYLQVIGIFGKDS